MMKKLMVLALLGFLFFVPRLVFGQEDTTVNIVDDIQFDLKSKVVNGDTLQVDLFVISYEKDPRDFRLNVFASTLVDGEGKSHMLHSVKMGRVLVLLSQRQNYLNYLLKQDVPVGITVKFSPLSAAMKKAKEMKLVFESLEEEGKFIEARIRF
ncbi:MULTISPECIES: hypothetical protein [Sphingobacterium]|uniref:Uncharacterized protein n=1 Tax=Sphingobacterium tenebrionis TaxID=3111775 RepID=A0ABU8I5L8_9SPHI|nr:MULTISPECIES: hypothetical protein [unclassified Sphingobacterium]QBR10802.1 hypothetical protein E3D81_00895 [Sphingobacterium sp. CZ-2]